MQIQNVYEPFNYGNSVISQDEAMRAGRVAKVLGYWRMYLGNHWGSEEVDIDKPTISRNKIKTIINKIITHAVGRSPYVNYYNEEIESLLKPYVDLLLENSGGMGILAYDTFLHGCVAADAFIKAVYDPTIKSVKLQVQESHLVDPYYDYIDNSIFTPDMVVLKYYKTARKITDKGTISQTLAEYKEIWDKDNLHVFIDGEKSSSDSGPNLLQKVPFIHIRNQIAEKNTFGMSDVADMEALNLLLNNSLRGLNDIVDYMGEPWMLAYGYKIGEMDKNGARCLSNLPPKTDGAATEFLSLDTDLPTTLNWIKMLEEGIHEQGGVPLSSSNGKTHMSNVSGTAYHYDMYPITETVDRKLLTYQPGLGKAIELGLELMYQAARKDKSVPFKDILTIPEKINSIYKGTNRPELMSKNWASVVVEFHDYLQKDEMTRTINTISKVNGKLLSKRTAMKELGVVNIEQELEYIKMETEQENVMLTKQNNSGSNEVKYDAKEKSSSPYEKDNNDAMRKVEKDNAKK